MIACDIIYIDDIFISHKNGRSEHTMKTYDIIRIENEDYKFIVFSTTYESPLAYAEEISKDLSYYNIKEAKVIFDMLLNMGNESDRFTEAYFDGNKFDISSFKSIDVSKKSKLRKISCNYFKTNMELLEYSILNSMQKKMLAHGLTI